MKLVIYPAVESKRWESICQAAGDMEVVNVDSENEAVDAIRDADAFFGKLTPPMLAAATRLRWVQTPTASLEHYMFPELARHDCTLTNMRGLFSDVIADQVMGYVLCFARNLHVYVRQQIQGKWSPVGGEATRQAFTTGPGTVSEIDRAHLHLSDQTLGVIGLGSIGSEVARRARSFSMSVVAVDPVVSECPSVVDELWSVSDLDRLLASSDFVVIAAPHTPDTEGLFLDHQYKTMKTSAYLINIGRGAIVPLDRLVAALETGQIAGAALDVFETEPLPQDHPLWRMSNVMITPHVAGFSPRIAERHLAVLLDNISRFRLGQPLKNVANKEKWF